MTARLKSRSELVIRNLLIKLAILYNTKLWQEKILMHLVNECRFTKIFLSNFQPLNKENVADLPKYNLPKSMSNKIVKIYLTKILYHAVLLLIFFLV